MKFLNLLFLFSFLFLNFSFAQTPVPPKPPEIFKVVEVMPTFPGCEEISNKKTRRICADKKMFEFVYSNLEYPAIARENGVEGNVVITFLVEKDGYLKNIKILRDIGANCGEEAKRVVEKMPKWNFGTQRGNPVRVQYNLHISFKLDSDLQKKIISMDSRLLDEQPRFPGCEPNSNPKKRKKKKRKQKNPQSKLQCSQMEMLKFIYKNIKYPPEARKNKTEGKVFISIDIEKDGSVSNPKIIRDVGDGCGEEAIRIINLMPKWIPGKNGGEIVHTTKYSFPIIFKLE